MPSFAKVNLYLRVLGKREDGFHELFTVFQTISLADELVFENASTLTLECEDPAVPLDDSNLILRAARSLDPHGGARIILKKVIPIGGGLGGGSSNAATALVGLNRLWQLGRSEEELVALASTLGSDVPFFLHGGTAIGTGRGEKLEPIPDFELKYMVVVTPDVHVSTAAAYARLKAQNLTNTDLNRILRVCRSELGSTQRLTAALVNDFEPTVFVEFSEIGRAKQRLLELGAHQALMSGSGASVFGIFDKEETRQAALKALDNEVNWRKFAVAAVSRNTFQQALGC